MVWKDADGTERGVDNAAEGDVSDEAGEVGHKAVRIDAGFHLFNTSHHLLLISVYDGLGGPGRPPLLRRYIIRCRYIGDGWVDIIWPLHNLLDNGGCGWIL